MAHSDKLAPGNTAWLASSAWTSSEEKPQAPFVLVDILDVQDDGAVHVSSKPSGIEMMVVASALSAKNAEPQPDNALLLNLSEAALLDNLLVRYQAEEPYTYTGGILTSVNPCKATCLYTAETMVSYAGRLLGGNRPPHLYAMAEEAYRLLLKTKAHQGMVISGVSGAGKTEANKIIMQYLCWRASHSAGQIGRNMTLPPSALHAAEQLASGGLDALDDLPRKILNSNVVFEAFGNASTTNNDNSSRFGKFVRLLFDERGLVRGARLSTYLLEKSRLVLQCDHERNFHVLYQLVGGGAAGVGGEGGGGGGGLVLRPAPSFHYLAQSGRYSIDGVDDAAEWSATQMALEGLGIDAEERAGAARILCGILHLGNIEFEDLGADATADGCHIGADQRSTAALAALIDLWGLAEPSARGALTTRRMDSSRGSTYSIGQTAAKATQTRDALAKAAYQALFAWIASRLNAHLRGGDDVNDETCRWVGLLDAFGFELLQRNSFEQLLINATNEQLQHFFLRCVMHAEQGLYEAEHIAWTPIYYKDNSATIATLHDKPRGVLPLVDEECRLPNGSDESFAGKAKATLQAAGHEQTHQASRGGSARSDRARRTIKALFAKGIPHFTVRHFAGEVRARGPQRATTPPPLPSPSSPAPSSPDHAGGHPSASGRRRRHPPPPRGLHAGVLRGGGLARQECGPPVRRPAHADALKLAPTHGHPLLTELAAQPAVGRCRAAS